MNLGELIEAGVVISIATLLLIPTSASALAVGDDDVELIIRGGFGVHFIVKKEAGAPKVIANFTVYGRGIIDDRRFHNSSGHFPCFEFAEETELWYIIHPMFLPITATLEANGKKVTRRGINTIYIVIFLTWEIEDVR